MSDLKNYRVAYTTTVTIYVDVEAENEDQAIEIANEKNLSLTSYCGNGGCDKLVGVSDDDMSVEPGWGADFDDVYEN